MTGRRAVAIGVIGVAIGATLLVVPAPVGVVTIPSAYEGFGAVTEGHASCPGAFDEYTVTTLSDGTGAGTFRTGIATGCRRIRFSVGGTITFNSDLNINQDYLTIDGCTAPSPGITFVAGSTDHLFSVRGNAGAGADGAHDIIIQCLRTQGPGGHDDTDNDLLAIDGGANGASRIIFHRNTCVAANDGCADIFGEVTDVTYSWNFIKDTRTAAVLGDAATCRERISYHHNVFANNNERQVKTNHCTELLDYTNNVVYGWGWQVATGTGLDLDAVGFTSTHPIANIKNNVLHYVDTVGDGGQNQAILRAGTGGAVFFSGNILPAGETNGNSTATEHTIAMPVTTYAANTLGASVVPCVGTVYRTAGEQTLLNTVMGAIGGTSGAACDTSAIFVDPTIGVSACLDYHPDTRTCGPGVYRAFTTIPAAQAITNPGDVVEIRAGTYSVVADGGFVLSRSGTSGNLITYRGYAGDVVIIKGPYDVDTDMDGIRNWDENCAGDACGPPGSDEGNGFLISGNFIHLSRVRVQWIYKGVLVTGSNNRVTEVVSHDNWEAGVQVDSGDDNVFAYNATYRIRRRSGTAIEPPNNATDRVERNAWYRVLTWKNGRQTPDDARVLPFTGDPDGGGNADGFGASKECNDEPNGGAGTTVRGICEGNTFQEGITWRNIDDCYDTSLSGSYVINAIGWDCGPNARAGWKNLRAQHENYYSGLIMVGANAADSLDWPLRHRFGGGGPDYVIHSLARNAFSQEGIRIFETAAPSQCFVRNNLAWDNGGGDYFFNGCVNSANYAGGTTDPQLTTPTFNPSSAVAAAETCVTSAPHSVTVQSCWQTLYDAFYNAFKPAVGSAQINAGVVVAGRHCPLADDNGQNPASACRHWMGAAPDQGPFEFGLTGNPDKTRCVEVGACAAEVIPPAAPGQRGKGRMKMRGK